ncbi:MAG: sugar phosphorylase [Hydrococcus sp. C42_A2020_068]|nr:sugar phosphorylase [Hydrococcus sp. C42_A2020_068]
MKKETSRKIDASSKLQKPWFGALIPHNSKPDFTRPLLEISAQERQRILARLSFLYGETEAKRWMPELERILKVYYAYKHQEAIAAEREFDRSNRFTERDLILITYGDLLRSNSRSPLVTLERFIRDILRYDRLFSTIHLLPFFPYSSDRGFSITDFTAVNLSLGSWEDIEEIGEQYQLMFDGVFNHVSSQGKAFQEMLGGNRAYKDWAIVYHSPDELTPEQRRQIVRPRTSDVLTRYQSIDGPIWVWTTFSADQIDLNYKNPKVLMGTIETLLLYVRHGADIIRLDAATYLWKEPGTTCVNLPQTHELVKLFRDVLNVVAPGVALITETNVPHQDNISYFGDGSDEAQMVYNFALPPLVLYTFYKEDTTVLSEWAKDLEYPSATTTFFNILDTHDGIGLMGVKDILPQAEIDFIIQKAREHGSFVSYRTGADGMREPYEINTTWFSALNLDNSREDMAFQVKRFVASRSIALVLRGVPGIYFHGLIGTRNDVETVRKTKFKRDINRQVLQEEDLIIALKDPHSKLSLLAGELGKLLEVRVKQSAFHPNGKQQIFRLSPDVFIVWRTSPNGDEHILTLTNVTHKICQIEIPLSELGVKECHWYDLVGRRGWMAQGQNLEVILQPYDVVWLIPFTEIERSIESEGG